MSEIDAIFGTEERPLTVYERPSSGLVLDNDQALINQAQEDRRQNYVVVRENIDELIDNVRNVVLDAVAETRSNPSPRMLETFALLAKTYADLNMQLLDLPSRITGGQGNGEQKVSPVQNAIFIGSTESVVDLIREQRTK